ncbi:hypothetical protein PENTCL1PPCAC_19868, partial [Pristionchus entomophagus]
REPSIRMLMYGFIESFHLILVNLTQEKTQQASSVNSQNSCDSRKFTLHALEDKTVERVSSNTVNLDKKRRSSRSLSRPRKYTDFISGGSNKSSLKKLKKESEKMSENVSGMERFI